MSSNPYTQWPLWNMFTLMVRNKSFQNDNFRSQELNKPVSINNGAPSILTDVVSQSLFYNMYNDTIMHGSEVRDLKLIPTSMINSVLEADTFYVLKGKKDEVDGSGGECLPIVVKGKDMIPFFDLISVAFDGENYTEALSEFKSSTGFSKDFENDLLTGSLYSNPFIANILDKYSRSQTKKDLSDLVRKLSNTLNTSSLENKVINLASGMVNTIGTQSKSTATSTELYDVTNIGNNRRSLNVAFTFKHVPESERPAVRKLLETVFQATKSKVTSKDTRARIEISNQPVEVSPSTYRDFLPSSEFGDYLLRTQAQQDEGYIPYSTHDQEKIPIQTEDDYFDDV